MAQFRHHPSPLSPRRTSPTHHIRAEIGAGAVDRAGPLARLVRHGETQWTSATFTGARHTFVLRFEGAQAIEHAEHLTLAIGDDDITIHGALIAELTVTHFTQTMLPEQKVEIEISALLLDQ